MLVKKCYLQIHFLAGSKKLVGYLADFLVVSNILMGYLLNGDGHIPSRQERERSLNAVRQQGCSLGCIFLQES